MLGGRDSYRDIWFPHFGQRDSPDYLDHGSAVVVGDKTAAVERAAAVDNLDFVAGTTAQHPDGMCAFVGRQFSRCLYIGSIKAYHLVFFFITLNHIAAGHSFGIAGCGSIGFARCARLDVVIFENKQEEDGDYSGIACKNEP